MKWWVGERREGEEGKNGVGIRDGDEKRGRKETGTVEDREGRRGGRERQREEGKEGQRVKGRKQEEGE